MARLLSQTGVRAPSRVIFPFAATLAAQAQKLIPALDQSKAPTGYDLAYGFDASRDYASPGAALQTIIERGNVPVQLVREPAPELSWWQKALSVAGTLLSFTTYGGAASTTLKGISDVRTSDPLTLQPIGAATVTAQGGPMSFQDGDSWGFGDIFSGINQGLQQYGSQLLDIGGQALTGYLSSLNQPRMALPVSAPAVATMAAAPAVIGASRAVATVGRGFFNRFPNLATAIQSLRNRGANVSRSTLYSAMRRFGPEMLVSGGLLTAAAVSELAVAGPGRRRMNPGNVKALRRAHRRMKSFHHLCSQNDVLRRRSRK